ncbi:PRC-barrel domain-containing protein [Streptomyces sp. MUM 203J]|nr:PRC-barrel domain-containing protein [Streptomyces sp. MUM 203J]
MGLDTAETLATVTGLAVATSPARIAALRLTAKGPGTLVTWNQIQAVGPDAITVRKADDIRTEADVPTPADKHHDPLGRRALTETGRELGPVENIEFDEATGRIQRLTIAGREIEGERLLGAGSYAVVVAVS